MNRPTATELGLPDGDVLDGLVGRAEQGDLAALPELREFLDTHLEIWRAVGDLGQRAEQAQIERVAGGDVLFKAALEKRLMDMRSELAGPHPSPLEKLLVDRVAITWLQVAHADLQAAQGGEMTVTHARFLHNRVQQAHKRFSHAVKQLALVRKLLARPGRGRKRRDTGENGHFDQGTDPVQPNC